MSSRYILSSKNQGSRPKFGLIIKRIIEANASLLLQQGIQLGSFLGAGYAGCVYQYDEQRVIKFTSNINEAALARFLIDKEDAVGFPTIYGVTEIKVPKFKKIFAILKEDIPTDAMPAEFVEIANQLCYVIDPYADIFDNEYEMGIALRVVGEMRLLPEVKQMFEQFAEFLLWCAKNDIFIFDIIDINLAYRTSEDNQLTLAVRDFSACQVF